MNTFKIRNRSITNLLCVLTILVLPTLSFADIANKNQVQTSLNIEADILVKDVLKNTESSLSLVESNRLKSLQHVEAALDSVRELKNVLSPDTHVETKSPLVLDELNEYWFMYPRVSNEILTNKHTFPTLHSKIESEILYIGDDNSALKDQMAAYFDYAFAYASLITAREAIIAKNYREATSSLSWVFHAIYINPDFNVAEYDRKLKLDNLLNINGDFPYISSVAPQHK